MSKDTIMTFKYFNSEGNICSFPINTSRKFKMSLFNMPLLDLDKTNTAMDMAILKSTLQEPLKDNNSYLNFQWILGLLFEGLMWYE